MCHYSILGLLCFGKCITLQFCCCWGFFFVVVGVDKARLFITDLHSVFGAYFAIQIININITQIWNFWKKNYTQSDFWFDSVISIFLVSSNQKFYIQHKPTYRQLHHTLYHTLCMLKCIYNVYLFTLHVKRCMNV